MRLVFDLQSYGDYYHDMRGHKVDANTMKGYGLLPSSLGGRTGQLTTLSDEDAVANSSNPLVRQRRLQNALRKARADSEYTQQEVADAMGWHYSKVRRIENGEVGISKNDLRALLNYYKKGGQFDEFWAMSQHRRNPSRWDEYREYFSREFLRFLQLEDSTSLLRQFEPQLIPGPLQTEGYAETVISLFAGKTTKEETIAARVRARLARGELIEKPDAPECFFVLDEAAISRWTGGPAIMLAQLRHLKEINQLHNVWIKIIRFETGAHFGQQGPFVILDFDEPNVERLLYLEYNQATGRSLVAVDDEELTKPYLDAFQDLEAIATSRDETDRLLDLKIEKLLRAASPGDPAPEPSGP